MENKGKRLVMTYKKTLAHPKADVARRLLFQEQIKHYKSGARPLLDIDESEFAHDMSRRYGYALKGQRCYGKHDWGARGRTNVIGALLENSLLT